MTFLLTQDKLACLHIKGNIEALTSYQAQDFLSRTIAFDAIFHPEDRDVYAAIFSHLPQVKATQLSYRIITKSGQVKILNSTHTKQAGSKPGETQISLSMQALVNHHEDLVNSFAVTNFIAMLENTDDYIYFKNRNHVFTGASQTLVKITDPTEHWTDLIGKNDYDVFTREYADIYFTLEKKVFSGSLPVAQEIQPTLDAWGNKGWIDNRKYPIKDKNGDIIGLFGIARDITELKQAEETLRKEQAFSKALLDSMPGIFYLYTYPELRLVLWNKQHEVLLGYAAEEMNGKHVTDWHAPEARDAVLQAVEKVMQEGQSEMEASLMAKNGRLVPFLLTGVRVEALGRPYFLGTGIDITKRKTIELELQASHDLFGKLSENVPGMIYQLKMTPDKHFSFPYASDAIWNLFGVTPDDVRDNAAGIFANLHQDDHDKVIASVEKSALTMQAWHHEYRINLPEKGTRWLAGSAKPEQQADGSVVWYGFVSDITKRKQAELKQQLSASVFTHAHEGITITDADGTIIEVNDAFTRITGFSREEALGQNPRILKSGRHPTEFYTLMWWALIEQGEWSGEIWNRHKNGEIYAVMLTISAVRADDGKTQNYVALLTNITQMKKHEQQLLHIAHYDALTGLPNRTLLADRLQQAMAQSQRRQQLLAVVYLDLDGFKLVNDQHGHDIGDELLIALSQRMKTALREVDTLARIGGDEFVAVLLDLDQTQDCVPVLNRLLEAASIPVIVGDAKLEVSASIGVTIFPHDGLDSAQLLRRADQAMYQAKQAGKNCYRLFDED